MYRWILTLLPLAMGVAGCSGKDEPAIDTGSTSGDGRDGDFFYDTADTASGEDTEPQDTEPPGDRDGDGTTDDQDCAPDDPNIYPGAQEICDGLDNDCDDATDDGDLDVTGTSLWYPDGDGDGFPDEDGEPVSACEPPPGYAGLEEGNADCDDDDATSWPGGDEVCDGADNDCDGEIDNDPLDAGWYYEDADLDGYGDPAAANRGCDQPEGTVDNDDDCDDTQSTVWPGAEEFCDELDNDCDSLIDEGDAEDATWYIDADGDGWGSTADSLEACEQPEGYVLNVGDCDDSPFTGGGTWPGADEYCDGVDNDCDGRLDDNAVDTSPWYADLDEDGFGDEADAETACEAPDGYVSGDAGYDCDDTDAAVNPDALEICDGIDNNCDEVVDDDAIDRDTWYGDGDGDGWGDEGDQALACEQPDDYVARAGDCDDGAASVHPEASETCDEVDEDCDDAVDEDASDATTWYYDGDRDGYADGEVSVEACDAPVGYIAGGGELDCDDSEAGIYPGAAEICDDTDQDCDDAVDEEALDATDWYADDDRDGYGDPDDSQASCAQPTGYTDVDGDCDDADGEINPGVSEQCDEVDNDCDTSVDEGLTLFTFYEDADEDGFGDPDAAVSACGAPEGYTGNGEDCDDGDGTIYPGAVETCDGADEDCDDAVDEDASDAITWYVDADGDGYGVDTSSVEACEQPGGYADNHEDCDDNPFTGGDAYPGGEEICDGLDNDCDGEVDNDAADASDWYLDADLDGYGGADREPTTSCDDPSTGYSSYTTDNEDCDDLDDGVNPGASESCDAFDEDCDAVVDEDGGCPCDLEHYGDHAYLLCTTTRQWSDASDDCTADNYDLVTIDDSDENLWLEGVLSAYGAYEWWMGYNDIAVENSWVWASGSSASFTAWHSGEPNNSGGGADCGLLRKWSDEEWADEACDEYRYFVCESP